MQERQNGHGATRQRILGDAPAAHKMKTTRRLSKRQTLAVGMSGRSPAILEACHAAALTFLRGNPRSETLRKVEAQPVQMLHCSGPECHQASTNFRQDPCASYPTLPANPTFNSSFNQPASSSLHTTTYESPPRLWKRARASATESPSSSKDALSPSWRSMVSGPRSCGSTACSTLWRSR